MRRQHRPAVRPDHRCSDDATARRGCLARQADDRTGLSGQFRGRARRTCRRTGALQSQRLRPRSRDGHRPGQGAVLGHATGQRWRAVLRLVPFRGRSRHPDPQPVESWSPGRRHGAGDLSQSPSGHTAGARGPERQPRSDRHRLPYAPLEQPRHPRRAAAQPGQRHARHQRRGVVHGHTPAPVQQHSRTG